MPLFDRFATVTVGEPGAQGVTISGLRVKFLVEKTNKGTPNKAVVQISNMKESTRNQIQATRDVMILEAGYRDDERKSRLSIQMDVVDVRTEIQKPDILTSITCADGINALKTKKLSVTFAGGTSVKAVLTKVANDAGVVLRDLASVGDAQYQQGFAGTGPIGNIIDQLAGRIDANWQFQNGELQLSPKDAPAGVFVSVINATTGLIGSPVKRNKAGDPSVPAQQNGWLFRSLLNPSIEPNGRVRLESVQAKGEFRVITVKHNGDTRGQEFFTDVEVEEWQSSTT